MKRIPLLILSTLVVGLGSLLASAQNSNQLEENKALVKRLQAAVSAGNLAEFDQLVSPDIIDHNPSPDQKPGLEGFKESFKPYFVTLPDIKVGIDADFISEGDKVSVRHYFSGTQNGAFGDIPATGRKVSSMAIDTWRIKNGKLVEVWHIEDLLGLVVQMTAPQALNIPAGTTKLSSNAGDSRINKALARRFYRAFNTRKFDDYDNFLAAEVIDHNPVPNQKAGATGLKEALQGFLAVFPDMKIKVEEIISQNDLVSIRGTATGTHQGNFLGVPATNKSVTFGFHDLYRVKDDKILEAWHVEELLQTLGFLSAK